MRQEIFIDYIIQQHDPEIPPIQESKRTSCDSKNLKTTLRNEIGRLCNEHNMMMGAHITIVIDPALEESEIEL